MNLVVAIMMVAMPVVTAPMPLTIEFLPPVGALLRQPTAHHAGLGQGKGSEDSDGIQRNECVCVA